MFLKLDRRLGIAMIDGSFSSGIGSLWGRFHALMESVKIAIPFPGARSRIDEENLAAFAVTSRRSSEHLDGESFVAFNYV